MSGGETDLGTWRYGVLRALLVHLVGPMLYPVLGVRHS